MSATVAIAAAASTSASIAAMRAREAEENACKGFIMHYKGSKSEEEMQQYAECVQMLYPKDTSADVLAGKVFFIVCVVSFICGAAFTPSYMKDGPFDYFMAGVVGVAFGVMGLLVAVLFCKGLILFF